MENSLGFLATQEGPLEVVLEVLYLFQPPNISLSLSQTAKMLTAEDLILCYGRTQAMLLSYHFFLLKALRSNSREHHNDLGILLLEL